MARPVRLEMRFIDDGDAAAGHELVLLGRIFVHNVGKQVWPHAGKVQQRIALGRSTVGRDPATCLTLCHQK